MRVTWAAKGKTSIVIGFELYDNIFVSDSTKVFCVGKAINIHSSMFSQPKYVVLGANVIDSSNDMIKLLICHSDM